MAKTRAVIYVPDDGSDRWEKICLEACDRRGYRVVGLVHGGVEKWPDLWTMLSNREADLVLVARKEHLDPDRVPRIEAVDLD